MSIKGTIKSLIFKMKSKGGQWHVNTPLYGGECGEGNENPYLNARRTWNNQSAANTANRQMSQLREILSLMIVLAAVGGMIYIGSQSKFLPYVVEVDKHRQPIAVAPAERVSEADPRVLNASVASFIADIRMVTPDVALQRKAIYHVYSMLSSKDAATAKANEWLNGTEESSPFKKAEKETVSIEIDTVIQHTPDTWQVDWVETVRDRQGVLKGKPYEMRALVTIYTVQTTPQTTEEQMRNNPLGIYVRDFSWSKQV